MVMMAIMVVMGMMGMMVRNSEDGYESYYDYDIDVGADILNDTLFTPACFLAVFYA